MKIRNHTGIRGEAAVNATLVYLTEQFLSACGERFNFIPVSEGQWAPARKRNWIRLRGNVDAAWCVEEVIPTATRLSSAVTKLTIAARAAEPDLAPFGCTRLSFEPIPADWHETSLLIMASGQRVFVAAPTHNIPFQALMRPTGVIRAISIPCEVALDITGLCRVGQVKPGAKLTVPRKVPGEIRTKNGDFRLAAAIADGKSIECGGFMEERRIAVSIQIGTIDMPLEDLIALRRGSRLELDPGPGQEVLLSVYGVPWATATMCVESHGISVKILELVETTKLPSPDSDTTLVNTTISGV